MEQVTLAIRNARDEQIVLRQGGLYWVALDQSGDAHLLARQFLEALPATHRATLVCIGTEPAAVVEPMAADSGPATLRLFAIEGDTSPGALFHELVVDFKRIRVTQGSQLVLMLPSALLDTCEPARLQQWCRDMRQWLMPLQATLLVISHGQSPQLHEQLLRLNEQLSGLAQVYRQDGTIHYQLNYWYNQLGVSSAQAFKLKIHDGRFALSDTQRGAAVTPRTDDQRIYLTQRLVLEGSAPLSRQWRLFEQREALLEQAVHARAASVIVAVESNQEVEHLASQLHDLREQCGTALKIIVREMEPCLRYRDERLLRACGANLLVPYDTTLASFLSMVESVQGQVWHEQQMPELEVLLDRLRPPAQRGVLSPAPFITLLEQIYNGAAGELDHQLLRLRPQAGLHIEQYLNQLSLRRFGDVACVVDEQFYLFLFACRGDGLEAALGNVCRLPWRDLFSECTVLSGVDALPRQAFMAAPALSGEMQQAVQQVTSDLAHSIAQVGYTPQRITLTLSEPCS